jgi:hypothetical protein
MGMLDRDERKVRASVVPNVKRETLQNEVLNNVKFGSPVYSDDAVPYDKLHSRYVHEVVNHAETYVNGRRQPTDLQRKNLHARHPALRRPPACETGAHLSARPA